MDLTSILIALIWASVVFFIALKINKEFISSNKKVDSSIEDIKKLADYINNSRFVPGADIKKAIDSIEAKITEMDKSILDNSDKISSLNAKNMI